VTRAIFLSARTPAQKAQIVGQYPFLRFISGQGIESSDSGSSESFRSYSGRGGLTRVEEHPPEVRSLPGGRKAGTKPRWSRP
jgi:hypothetical protein